MSITKAGTVTGSLPNCIYIGPGKTGSTWLFEFFKNHPDIFVTPAKDLYFFDNDFDRGVDWYARQFSGAQGESIVAEICHDYIVSLDAPRRIAELIPQVKLMMFVREPVDRLFSAYLYRVKHGVYTGSFEAAIDERPELLNGTLYSKHLREYVKHFPKEQILVFAFDDLQQDSQAFADEICRRLGVSPFQLPESMTKPVLKAARARSLWLAKAVKRSAIFARRLGLVNLVARMKMNPSVRKILYREFTDQDRPAPSPEIVAQLRDRLRPSVQELDEIMGTDFCRRWGY